MEIKTGIIKTVPELDAFLATWNWESDLYTYDTELTGLRKSNELLGITLYDTYGTSIFVFVDTPYLSGVPINVLRKKLQPIFDNGDWLCHNGYFDQWVLRNNGFIPPNVTEDSMILIHLVNNELLKNLETRVKEDFGYPKPTFKEIVRKSWDKIDWVLDTSRYVNKKGVTVEPLITHENLGEYAAQDGFWTYELYKKYKPLLEQDSKLTKVYYKIEIPLIEVLVDMKYKGVLIDKKIIADLNQKATAKLKELEQDIYETCEAEFNIGSSKQLGEILYDKLKYPVPFLTPKGKPSTDKHALEFLADKGYPVALKLKEHSKVSTLLTGFIDAIPRLLDTDGRLRGSLNAVGTNTSRISSDSPNLQNMPNDTTLSVRSAFIPKAGHVFIVGDESQVEPRILTHLTQDPNLIEIYKTGGDIYQGIADAIHITRKAAKVVVLALMYGMGANKLAESLGIKKAEAEKFIADFFKKFSYVEKWKHKIEQKAEENLYSETMFGRKRRLPHIANRSNKGIYFGALRAATNTTIQGSAADKLKLSMINVHKMFKEDYGLTPMLLTVHD